MIFWQAKNNRSNSWNQLENKAIKLLLKTIKSLAIVKSPVTLTAICIQLAMINNMKRVQKIKLLRVIILKMVPFLILKMSMLRQLEREFIKPARNKLRIKRAIRSSASSRNKMKIPLVIEKLAANLIFSRILKRNIAINPI